mgnify:CR=1 FL=1
MAKKHFGKLLTLAAIVGAAAAGVSYVLQYKSFHKELDEDFHDFEDDFGREERFDTVELSSFEADEDVFAGYDRRDELTIDDLDDLLGEQPKKRGHIEADDAFKVDFIDLD